MQVVKLLLMETILSIQRMRRELLVLARMIKVWP
jgi:hypothetical protein